MCSASARQSHLSYAKQPSLKADLLAGRTGGGGGGGGEKEEEEEEESRSDPRSAATRPMRNLQSPEEHYEDPRLWSHHVCVSDLSAA
ncbi:unnamed protein product [Merluccius merluccius]